MRQVLAIVFAVSLLLFGGGCATTRPHPIHPKDSLLLSSVRVPGKGPLATPSRTPKLTKLLGHQFPVQWDPVKFGEVNWPNRVLVYLPKDYATAGDTLPLVIYLHGAGERGDNLDHLRAHDLPKRLHTDPNFPAIVVSPQCPDGPFWEVAFLDHFYAEVGRHIRFDPERVVLTGISMGGAATWDWAQTHPDRFAGLYSICGFGNVFFAPRLKNLPIRMFHGALDDAVPPFHSDLMAAALTRAGVHDLHYKVYPSWKHESWVPAYRSPRLIPWILSCRRNNAPVPPYPSGLPAAGEEVGPIRENDFPERTLYCREWERLVYPWVLECYAAEYMLFGALRKEGRVGEWPLEILHRRLASGQRIMAMTGTPVAPDARATQEGCSILIDPARRALCAITTTKDEVPTQAIDAIRAEGVRRGLTLSDGYREVVLEAHRLGRDFIREIQIEIVDGSVAPASRR